MLKVSYRLVVSGSEASRALLFADDDGAWEEDAVLHPCEAHMAIWPGATSGILYDAADVVIARWTIGPDKIPRRY